MNTVIDILVERAGTDHDQLATIAKRRGRWLSTTVAELVERVSATAVGLVDVGVRAGDHVAVILANVPDWLVVDLAVQSIGATSVAVPDDIDHVAMAALLAGIDISWFVVNDPTDAARVQDHATDAAQHHTARFVCRGADVDGVTGLDTVIRTGREHLEAAPDAFRELLAARPAGAAVAATLTAGSGDRERAILHSSEGLVVQARRVVTKFDLGPSDVTVAVKHPSDPFERAVTIYPCVVSGAVLAYPENPSTIGQSILEVRPTFLHVPVDRVRAASATIHGRFSRNSGFKGLVAKLWNRMAFEPIRRGDSASGVALRVVGRPAQKSLGWENLRSLLVTGSRVPLDVLATMQALGVPVRGGYATVETGLIAAGVPRTSAGLELLDGINATIEGDRLSITGDGLETGGFTGDLGRVDGGAVVVRGPERSMVERSDGSKVLAAEVEATLRDSPYIALAAVRRGELGLRADIEVDFDSVSDWAAERKLHFTTFSSLVANEAVRALIADEVARLATDVAHHNLLMSPFQQGQSITRTRSIHQRGRDGDDVSSTSPTEHESASID